MCRLIIALFTLVSLALAAPANEHEVVAIVKQSAVAPAPDGSYSYQYETANGIQAAEEGQVRVQGNEHLKEVTGSFTYTAPDGTPIHVTYNADANGFHPEGEHIPKLPAHVQRSLNH